MTTSNESAPKTERPTFYFYDRITEGLTIFKKYPHSHFFNAEHDEVFAGPDPSVVSSEDLKRLNELGWNVSDWGGSFQMFV